MTRPNLPALERPTVSIVICNFNHVHFVASAIRSALEQTVPCEVIVVDDGSTDESLAVLTAWQDRVTLITQSSGGQRSAYNTGFARASGDIVLFLDADDLLFPEALERVIEEMGDGVAKVHFRLALTDREGRALGNSIPSVLATGDVADQLRRGILHAAAPGSGNAYRREVLERLMPVPTSESDRNGADFFLIYASSIFGEVRAITEPLGRYRLHYSGAPDTRSEFVFGNAAATHDREAIVNARVRELRQWVAERSGGEFQVPQRVHDFSHMKSVFARRVFDSSYLRGVFGGVACGPELLLSVWLHGEYTLARKLGLSIWALLLVVAPRNWGRPLARYVVNPGSR